MSVDDIVIGYKFGYYEVVSKIYVISMVEWKRPQDEKVVDCKCVCGTIKTRRIKDIINNVGLSCGCKRQKYFLKEENQKKCYECLNIKDIKEFSKNVTTKDGLAKKCKLCCRGQQLKWSYGLSLEEYENLLKQQDGKCACCGTEDNLKEFGRKGKYFDVDHCHKTGKIRGLICGPCNSGISRLGDGLDKVLLAYNYLKRFEDSQLKECEQSEHVSTKR